MNIIGKCGIDLVLIVDTSMSVLGAFEKELEFAIGALSVPSGADYDSRMQTAVITFRQTATLHKPLGKATKEATLSIVRNLTHTGIRIYARSFTLMYYRWYDICCSRYAYGT